MHGCCNVRTDELTNELTDSISPLKKWPPSMYSVKYLAIHCTGVKPGEARV